MRKSRIAIFGCILCVSLLGQATAEPGHIDTELQQALLPKDARDLPVRDSAAPLRLTLEQVIKQVLSRSPSAQSALLDIKRAQALQEQARAGSLRPWLCWLATTAWTTIASLARQGWNGWWPGPISCRET